MNGNPLVSVIMPSFNHAAYIGEAIESVLKQTYTNWELIVVDNFSQDATDQVVEQFHDKRIQYVKFNNHGVIAAARNYAASYAVGEYIAFLDSDDIWREDKLVLQLDLFIQQAGGLGIGSNIETIGAIKQSYNHFSRLTQKAYWTFSLKDMLKTNWVVTSSMLIRRNHFIHLNGFDESPEYCFIEDIELWLRLLSLGGNILVINQPLVQYRVLDKPGRDVRKLQKNRLKIAGKLYQNNMLTKKQVRIYQRNVYPAIAKASLDVHDKWAAYYYTKALLLARNTSVIFKMLAGIFLSLLPAKVTDRMVCWLTCLRSKRN